MARLGRYELGPTLGVGGFGRVVEAVLVGPGGFRKPVALKVLHQGAEELRREARIGGLLRHPNLVDVYEIGEDDGQWFCAMELCDGALVDCLPLPPRAVVEVGLQVCAALQYAHEELGLVHLDIKPANLLLDGGTVKVADLGVSTAKGFGVEGKIRGTPAYMPLEQAQGKPVDARTDIFALGIALAELATGRLPSLNDTLDLDFLAEAVAPRGTGIPEWLEPVVLRCIERRPEDRYQDMAALADALRSLEVDGPGLAEALGLPEAPPSDHQARPSWIENDPLVGRTAELAELAGMLQAGGLVTVKGPAGIGKTRLATAAAGAWARDGEHRAWVAELAGAYSLDGLVGAVARAMNVPLRTRGDEAEERLGRALAGRGPLLLVLDNFEQIVDLAPVVEAWASAAPEARFLVTSRQPLGVAGEQVFELGPLDPDAARALVVERARERAADVADHPRLAELAQRLDGLPLALELAAGRLGVLSVDDVLERLSLSLLRAGTSGRHSTLQAALQWSWDLLDPAQQSALAQLSVFAGGLSLELAEEVVALEGGTVLGAVGELVERSMVRAQSDGRFSLLVGVQAFARQRLQGAEEVEHRHGAAFARLAREVVERGFEGHGAADHQAFSMELDNLLVACDLACARDEGEVAAATLEGAWSVLERLGPFELGLSAAERVLDVPSLPAAGKARALMVAGQALRNLGRGPESSIRMSEGAALAEQIGLEGLRGKFLHNLGIAAAQGGQGDPVALLEEAIAVQRAAGLAKGVASTQCALAIVTQRRGRPDEAERLYTEALRGAQAHGARKLEGTVLGNWGTLCDARADRSGAHRFFEQALAIHQEVRDRSAEAHSLGNLATVLQQEGDVAAALALHEAAVRIARELGDRLLEGFILVNVAACLTILEREEESEEMVRRALALNRAAGNKFFECISMGSLGTKLCRRGELAEGKSLLEEAIALARACGFVRLEGYHLGKLALFDAREDAWDTALENLDRGEALLEKVGDSDLLGGLVAERAEVLWHRGSAEEALAELDRAEEIAPPGNGKGRLQIVRVRALIRGTASEPAGGAGT